MATRTADIHIRIEPTLKSKAEQVFARDGYSITDAFTNFCRQSVYKNRTIAAPKRKCGAINADALTAEQLDNLVEEARISAKEDGTVSIDEFRKEFETVNA